MDFGPRYADVDDTVSSVAEENDDFRLALEEDQLSDDFGMAETPTVGQDDVNGQVLELTKRLHVLHALNDVEDYEELDKEEIHRHTEAGCGSQGCWARLLIERWAKPRL